MTATTTLDLCPNCQVSLAVERDEAPWCERCEWNLDAYSPPAGCPWYVRSIARRDQRAGFQSDLRLVSVDPTADTTVGGDFVFLCVVSAVLVSLPLAALVGGGWLVLEHRSGPHLLLGLLLLPIGYELRPRLGRVRRYLRNKYPLDPQRTPALHGLIERIAAETGAPRPDIVALDIYSWNASAAVAGIRRRRILTLGLPLLISLQPQEIVALLGHELGHFANKDSRRNLLTQPARSTFGRLSSVFARSRRDALDRRLNGLYALVYELWRLIGGILSWLLFGVHLAINIVGAREDRRAERRADIAAVRAGGTTATLGMLDAMAGAPLYAPVISGVSKPGHALQEWRTAIAADRARNADGIVRLRQLTIRREASLFASHSTTGRRHQFLGMTSPQPPAVTVTESESAQLDRELGPYAERLRLNLAEQYEM